MGQCPVLVVDDESGIRDLVALILGIEGYPVWTAANGAEALDLLEREPPAVLLLDMRMPVLDGWGVARALQERGVAIPIVVMTAAVDASRWAAEVGAAAYLAKPFDLVDLLATVEQICQAA